MGKEREGKKERAEIKAVAENDITGLLEEWVEWQKEHPQGTWMEMEVEVMKLQQQFGKQLLQRRVQEWEGKQEIPGPKCRKCGREMRYKGEKERGIVSLAGEVKLKRGYYYCSECKEGIFPPG